MELDNEPLSDCARSRAIRNIFVNVMNSIGLWHVRSTIKKGYMPCIGVLDVSSLKSKTQTTVLRVPTCYADRQPTDLVMNFHNPSYRNEPIFENKILAGESDVCVLWAMLLEAWRIMYNAESYSPHGVECQWRFQSLQLMCLDHKKRLFNSLKESCSYKAIKDYSVHNLSDFYLGQEGIHLMQDNKQTECDSLVRDGYISDLKLCMLEHLNFGDNHCKEKLHRNESYEADITLYLQRIIRLQAIAKGFLVRNKCREHLYLQHAKSLHGHKIINICAATKIQAYWKGWSARKSFSNKKLAVVKIQALWRGSRTRRRFQLVMKNSIYDDSDEFDYTTVDDSLFLPENFCFEELDLDKENIYRYSFQEMASQQLHHFQEEKPFFQSNSNENVHSMNHYKVLKIKT